jgi:hypothetical protein
MRKSLALLSFLILLAGCGSKAPQEKGVQESSSAVEKVEKSSKRCSLDTPLAEGKGIKVTLSDYRYTLKLLGPKAKNYFSAHPEELLKRMVNRRLVVAYVNQSGLAQKSGLAEEMEEFKKEWLSRYYVSAEAKKRLKPVTREQIVERFKELFPKKDPSKMSKGDEEFIRHELQVKEFDRAVNSLYQEVEKNLKVEREGDRLVARCCGVEVSLPVPKGTKESELKELKESLKQKFFTEYFYRKAVEAGYDKLPRFKHMYQEYYATRAVELFRKALESKIKVSDEEAKEFYEKNRNRFVMPDRAQAVVLYFKTKKQALEAEKLLKSGKSWEEVARRFGQFNAKPKVYYRDPKDPIGTLIFVEGAPKKGETFVADFGGKYALVYVLKYQKGGLLPYEEVKNYVKLVLKRQKLREAEEKELKKLWKEFNVKLENLECIKGA